MPWIPHLMVLDDDSRVLQSLVPSFVTELADAFNHNPTISQSLRKGDPRPPGGAVADPIRIKVTAHGFSGERVASQERHAPHHIHLHLVRERGGRFDLARKLLNDQLFAVVVSDLRFSEDAGGQRAGQLFVDELARIHPQVQGILYSAYPRPESFPADRFVRKGGGSSGGKGQDLTTAVVSSMARHLAVPSVAAFASKIGELGVVYQSDAFGTILAQLFDLARLFSVEAATPRLPARSRRPLPCLLLDGESGTGKRILAELLHAASDRRKENMAVASCNELTNETLLRSILFGHKRGAFTDAREDRAGLVASAGKGVILLDDFHRLPTACSAILHSFLEDGEYSRLGEEEVRRQAEAAVILTVETGPWQERRRSGELPLAFLARVERLPLAIPPLRDRPEDIEAQARWLAAVISAENGETVELDDDAIESLKAQPFSESNSRELRNVIERAIFRHKREADVLTRDHLRPFLAASEPSRPKIPSPLKDQESTTSSASNDWTRRLRSLAAKILAKGSGLAPEQSALVVARLFDETLPPLWPPTEAARTGPGLESPIPWPIWEDLWRCYSVSHLGGPSPAERVLGIPANTLRQWINDRESR